MTVKRERKNDSDYGYKRWGWNKGEEGRILAQCERTKATRTGPLPGPADDHRNDVHRSFAKAETHNRYRDSSYRILLFPFCLLLTHDDVIHGDEDHLDDESNEAHSNEADGGGESSAGVFSTVGLMALVQEHLAVLRERGDRGDQILIDDLHFFGFSSPEHFRSRK
jgi:hypothetical protein